MIKLYPDRPLPAMLRGLADLIVIAWTIAWVVLGWLIYETVLGLEVIADGLTSTGHTFNGWIKQFHDAIPGGIPGVTQFLLNIADALRSIRAIRWCQRATRSTTPSSRWRSCWRC